MKRASPPQFQKKLAALGEWFRELSALLAVFPLVDQLVLDGVIVKWMLVSICMSLALIFLLLGLILPKED
jgi:uncharacterized membrane protein YozB (DUF420 family)